MMGGWQTEGGAPVTCDRKRDLLERTELAISRDLQDAFEEAVLMGVEPAFFKARLYAIVDNMKDPRRR